VRIVAVCPFELVLCNLGDTVDFTRSTFEGGEVHFRSSTFSGGTVDFRRSMHNSNCDVRMADARVQAAAHIAWGPSPRSPSTCP
jgi:hypothetical protein